MISKLLKYEFLRRKNMLLAFAIILVVAEGLTLFGLYKGDGWMALSVFMCILMVGATYFYALVDTIGSYYSDLKQKHGYMLFLTPVSGYKIIGSKALFGLMQLFVSVMVLFLMMLLNFKVSSDLYLTGTELQQVWDAIITGFKGFIPNLVQIIQFIILTLMQWFNIIMMAIFAITLSKTIFSNSQHRFLLSLLIFILLSIAIQAITVSVLAPFGLFGEMIKIESINGNIINGSLSIGKYFTIGMALYAVYISAFYFLSGRLLHKRIDL